MQNNLNYNYLIEKNVLIKLADKLDFIENDLEFIRNHLNQERNSFKDLKKSLEPILGFLNVPTSTNNSSSTDHTSKNNQNTRKSVKFSSPDPDLNGIGMGTESETISQKIAILTESEFQGLPKYLKGRLNIQKINFFISDFNRFVEEKYLILLKGNPAKLSVEQRQRFFEWKSAENDETSSKFFLTESDLRGKSGGSGSFKFDQVARNILTILRQVGRIKEVRSVGIIRYVITS